MLQIFAEALLLATGQRPHGQTNQKRHPAVQTSPVQVGG